MRTLVICTLPRTGSSYLCEQIILSRTMGRPREYFHPNQRAKLTEEWGLADGRLPTYCEAIKAHRTLPDDAVGMKLMLPHVRRLVTDGEVTEPALPNLIEMFGPVGEATIVKLIREDRVRQAISLVRARQTGGWSSLTGAAGEPVFDRKAIAEAIERIHELEREWDDALAGWGLSAAVTMRYEDFDDIETAVRRIGEAAGVEVPDRSEWDEWPDARRHRRQRDDINEEWAKRYVDG